MRVLGLAALLPLAGCDILVGTETSVDGVGVAGCAGEDGGLTAGWEAALTLEGCHWYIRGVDEQGAVLLTFDVPEFAAALDGEPASVTYTLPDDAVRIEVETGCGLSAGVCNEDTGFGSSVFSTYTPTAGSVAVTLTPEEDGAVATLVFTGVTLENEGGETIPLDATLSTRIYAE